MPDIDLERSLRDIAQSAELRSTLDDPKGARLSGTRRHRLKVIASSGTVALALVGAVALGQQWNQQRATPMPAGTPSQAIPGPVAPTPPYGADTTASAPDSRTRITTTRFDVTMRGWTEVSREDATALNQDHDSENDVRCGPSVLGRQDARFCTAPKAGTSDACFVVSRRPAGQPQDLVCLPMEEPFARNYHRLLRVPYAEPGQAAIPVARGLRLTDGTTYFRETHPSAGAQDRREGLAPTYYEVGQVQGRVLYGEPTQGDSSWTIKGSRSGDEPGTLADEEIAELLF